LLKKHADYQVNHLLKNVSNIAKIRGTDKLKIYKHHQKNAVFIDKSTVPRVFSKNLCDN